LVEALNTTLSAVAAAIVGEVMNLAVCFGLRIIFLREGSVDLIALLILRRCLHRTGPPGMG
jgi:hypothetical protein